jgi:hypothetical protein
MTLLPYGICIIGLLSAVAMGFGMRQLRPRKLEVQRFLGIERIRMLTRGMLVAPFLAVLGLIGFYLFYLKDNQLERIAHGTFIFGLWIILTIVFFVLALITRLGIRPAVQTLAAPVLAVPLVAYLTPLNRFIEVFEGVPSALPLSVGGVIIASGYFLIYMIRRELL